MDEMYYGGAYLILQQLERIWSYTSKDKSNAKKSVEAFNHTLVVVEDDTWQF